MALYGGRTGNQLTISDALTTGYKFLLKPDFVIPILVIGVVINAIVTAVFTPFVQRIAVGDVNSPAQAGAILGSYMGAIVAVLVASVIGGLILNLYGQVWAVLASTGEPPTMQQAFARVSSRWISVLGAGLITGIITLGGFLAITVVAALLGGIGILVMLIGFVALAYVGLRLSMAGWLAAEGSSAMDAVNGSWAITKGDLLVIFGWSIVFAIVIGVLGAILGIVLNLIPIVGQALTSTVGAAFGFGASVTLYRRVKDNG